MVVSYFEWVRNISQMRFGRLEKRRDEAQIDQLIKVVEKMTNQKMSKIDKLKRSKIKFENFLDQKCEIQI